MNDDQARDQIGHGQVRPVDPLPHRATSGTPLVAPLSLDRVAHEARVSRCAAVITRFAGRQPRAVKAYELRDALKSGDRAVFPEALARAVATGALIMDPAGWFRPYAKPKRARQASLPGSGPETAATGVRHVAG